MVVNYIQLKSYGLCNPLAKNFVMQFIANDRNSIQCLLSHILSISQTLNLNCSKIKDPKLGTKTCRFQNPTISIFQYSNDVRDLSHQKLFLLIIHHLKQSKMAKKMMPPYRQQDIPMRLCLTQNCNSIFPIHKKGKKNGFDNLLLICYYIQRDKTRHKRLCVADVCRAHNKFCLHELHQ